MIFTIICLVITAAAAGVNTARGLKQLNPSAPWAGCISIGVVVFMFYLLIAIRSLK